MPTISLFPALAAEYLFLMACINGLCSFGHRSKLAAARQRSERESTEIWEDALARAKQAHLLCRDASRLARKGKYEEAEETATRGNNELKERLVSTQFS
jgi:hypothetical protein